MDSLLSKRKELVHKQNLVIRDYRIQKIGHCIINDYGIKDKTISLKMKKLKKQYEALREEIYNVEDKIHGIDEGTLDDVVEPNPEDIEDALHLFTDTEWNRMK